MLKPSAKLCFVYECPKCFTKSVHHTTEDNLKEQQKIIAFKEKIKLEKSQKG